jgi:hypothetical protein
MTTPLASHCCTTNVAFIPLVQTPVPCVPLKVQLLVYFPVPPKQGIALGNAGSNAVSSSVMVAGIVGVGVDVGVGVGVGGGVGPPMTAMGALADETPLALAVTVAASADDVNWPPL